MEPHIYPVVDVKQPELYKELFPYNELPKVVFDFKTVSLNMPEEIFITDTTFRDGQQAFEPYTIENVTSLYDLLHELGGSKGMIRWSAFFLYSKRDREATDKCRERGYKYPKVTGWIRATKGDFQLVKEMKLEETGILTAISDYHIFYKFNSIRSKVVEKHLSVVEESLRNGIACRCHLEDVTRADIERTVLPFVQRTMKLSEKYKIPNKKYLIDKINFLF